MGKRKPQPPISAEEFAAWRDDPVTQVVLQKHADFAELQRAGWMAASWDGGDCDPLLRTALKERAVAYQAIADCTYEHFVNLEEPE